MIGLPAAFSTHDVRSVVIGLGDDALAVRLDLDVRAAAVALPRRRVVPAAVQRLLAARHEPVVRRREAEARQIIVAARRHRRRCRPVTAGQPLLRLRDGDAAVDLAAASAASIAIATTRPRRFRMRAHVCTRWADVVHALFPMVEPSEDGVRGPVAADRLLRSCYSPRMARPPLTDYEKYIRTEELLALQKGADNAQLPRRAAVPDRAPGRRAVDEARRARDLVRRRRSCATGRPRRGRCARSRACAASRCCSMDQLSLLDTMAPRDYMTIRNALGRGSGQESPGFRRMLQLPDEIWPAFEALLAARERDAAADLRAARRAARAVQRRRGARRLRSEPAVVAHAPSTDRLPADRRRARRRSRASRRTCSPRA